MMWILIETTAILAEALLVARLMIRYFGYRCEKAKFLKSVLLFSVIFIIDCIGTFAIKSELIFVAGFIFATFLFSIIFLNGQIFEKILISAISYSLIYFVNLPILNIISIISGMTATELAVAQNTSRIICLFCTKVLYFIATQCILWFRKKETYKFKLNEWIIVVSVFLITLLIGLALHAISLQSNITDYVCFVVTVLLSVLDVIIFIFIRKINISSQKETERELLQLQLHQQQNEMQNLEHQYQEISILRHDYQNKISCIHTLLSQGEYDDARKYVENLLGNDFNKIHSHIQCSSSVINAVINEKFGIAEKNNIETSCRIVVVIPEYLEYDLSVLLANLLDNAIEACKMNQVNSQIIVTITETAGYFRVVVKNTLQKSVLTENHKLESRKPNKAKHGWGLKSVREIAKRHNGTVDIYERNLMFIVSTLLMKHSNSNMGD